MSYNKTRFPSNLDVLSDVEKEYLKCLVQADTPICAMSPHTGVESKDEFNFSTSKDMRPSLSRINNWQLGYALFAKTGVKVDVIDIDPRNGGWETFDKIKNLLPNYFAKIQTPGGGLHFAVPSISADSKSFHGIDYLGLKKRVFLPGTHRPKYQGRGYTILELNGFTLGQEPDTRFYDALVELQLQSYKAVKDPAASFDDLETKFSSRTKHAFPPHDGQTQMYGARGLLREVCEKVATAPYGNRHNVLLSQAFRLGHYNLDDVHFTSNATEALIRACTTNGLFIENPSATIRTITDGLTFGRFEQNQQSKGDH